MRRIAMLKMQADLGKSQHGHYLTGLNSVLMCSIHITRVYGAPRMVLSIPFIYMEHHKWFLAHHLFWLHELTLKFRGQAVPWSLALAYQIVGILATGNGTSPFAPIGKASWHNCIVCEVCLKLKQSDTTPTELYHLLCVSLLTLYPQNVTLPYQCTSKNIRRALLDLVQNPAYHSGKAGASGKLIPEAWR